jgi:hypothetical protein
MAVYGKCQELGNKKYTKLKESYGVSFSKHTKPRKKNQLIDKGNNTC